MERRPETFEPPKRYSVPNLSERVKVKVQVMQRVKGRCVDLAGPEKVPEVGPRKSPASVAMTRGIGRPIVLRVLRILNIDRPLAREQLSIPGVPRRKHAVEEIDAARHRLHEVLWRSRAHQVARAVLRQAGGRISHDLVHDVCRFADAQSTDGIGLEANPDRAARAFLAQFRGRAALYDAELRLARVGDGDAVPRKRGRGTTPFFVERKKAIAGAA